MWQCLLSTSSWSRGCFGTLILALSLGLVGCASSQSPAELAAERDAVIGTWEYDTDEISFLQYGTLTIHVQDGELVGRLRDQWRGKLKADVRLHGRHLELILNRARIVGRIERGRFRGTVSSQPWHVTQSSPDPLSSPTFVARRVRTHSIRHGPSRLGCPSLLRESSYACSPFQRRF